MGFVWDERLMWHETGPLAAHVPPGRFVEPELSAESPPAKRRLRNLLEVSGLLSELAPIRARPASRAELLRFHSEDYLRKLEELSTGTGGDAGDGAPLSHGSFEIAALAAGGAIRAVEEVMAGNVMSAYALIRPPGHHAEPDRGRGFCLLANVALAGFAALQQPEVERLAIVDWDVHHGNGTQGAFWDEPNVLTISIHQDRSFPLDSGGAEELGAPAASGSNLNIPLPPGCGHGAYEAAFRQLIIPALHRHRPQLILISCGLDACGLDPYGRMLLHSESFRMMAGLVRTAAEKLCDGRAVACHEGGYSSAYAPFCGLAVIEELSGTRTGVQDPFLAELQAVGQQELQPHQARAIEAAAMQRPAHPRVVRGAGSSA